MAAAAAKKRLRSEMLARRHALAPRSVSSLGEAVRLRLASTPEYAAARTVALYWAVDNEVPTAAIVADALAAGKSVCLPRVNGRSLSFHRVLDTATLRPGSYGVPEPPDDGQPLRACDFDLVVVPGVAFDMRGARLGYGMGYYDRWLAGVSAPVAALAYDFQVVEEMETDGHDVPVTVIVTDRRVLRPRPRDRGHHI